MIKDEDQINSNIKLEEIELNPERSTFENKLRRKNSKQDIDLYFETINEVKVLGWENKLLESKLQIRDLRSLNDAEILNAELDDIKVMKIIKGDIERTRVKESIYMPSFKEYLYQILIYYIKANNILYKQGLNEIAGTFVLRNINSKFLLQEFTNY